MIKMVGNEEIKEKICIAIGPITEKELINISSVVVLGSYGVYC